MSDRVYALFLTFWWVLLLFVGLFFQFCAPIPSLAMSIELHIVESKAQIALWHGVTREIYLDYPQFVPHLQQDVEKLFKPKSNRLLDVGFARRWVAMEGQRCIGRIAAFFNPKYSDGQAQRTGGMGFFECINHPQAAQMLLQVAEDFLLQNGMQAVDGPINFGEKEAYWGLLIDNFHDINSFRMNFNPPYYRTFWEDFGFREYYRQICFKRQLNVPVQDVFLDKSQRFLQNKNITIRNMRGRSLAQMAHDFVLVYNNAWAGNFGFKTLSYEQAYKVMRAMRPMMDKDIIIFVYDAEKPIAFYVNLPEVNEFMRYSNGSLTAWRLLRVLWAKWFAKRQTMVGMVFGIDRAYQGQGVEGAMIKWTQDHVFPLGRYSDTIMTWIGDFNPKMLKIADRLGASPYRTLATYRKMLDKNCTFERHPSLHEP